MNDRLLIYGATGFTGQLIREEALARGLRPVLAGRSQAKLEAMARRDHLECRTFALADRGRAAAMLDRVDVVLNAAGPFSATAVPLAQACIAAGVHYLDISGEFATIESLAGLDAAAAESQVMLLVGAGFDVVPTDCAAALVYELLPTAGTLSIALSGLNAISRGSARTVFEQFGELVTVRRSGRLQQVTPGELMCAFDFGDGPRRTTAVSWADVSTAYYTTGIPDITVYYEATPIVELGLSVKRYGGAFVNMPGWKWWQDALSSLLPDGPTPKERGSGRAAAVVRAVDAKGRWAEVRLQTPEVYSFTALASVSLVDRVLAGDYKVGFQTPALAYGSSYGLSLPGVSYTKATGHRGSVRQ